MRRRFMEQGGRCYLCGEPMTLDGDANASRFATLDHVIPVHDGGGRSCAANLKAAHRECNMRRGAETGTRRKAEVKREILAARLSLAL